MSFYYWIYGSIFNFLHQLIPQIYILCKPSIAATPEVTVSFCMRAGWWAIRLQISFKWNLQSASKQKINHRKHYKIDSIPQEAGWKTLAWQEDLLSNSDMEILNFAKKIQAAKLYHINWFTFSFNPTFRISDLHIYF